MERYRLAHDIEQTSEPSALAAQLATHVKANFEVLGHDQFMSELSHGHTIFEGAQGFFLDENFGSSPHTTWSTTTPKWALELAAESGVSVDAIWGAMRTYATRHGDGPFPGEGVVEVPGPHNGTTEWAGDFRTGAHDASMLSWAIERTGVNVLSVSWRDRFNRVVTTDGPVDPGEFGVVGLSAYGPARSHRVEH